MSRYCVTAGSTASSRWHWPRRQIWRRNRPGICSSRCDFQLRPRNIIRCVAHQRPTWLTLHDIQSRSQGGGREGCETSALGAGDAAWPWPGQLAFHSADGSYTFSHQPHSRKASLLPGWTVVFLDFLEFTAPCGLRVVRIDPLHFLAGCRTRQINQA